MQVSIREARIAQCSPPPSDRRTRHCTHDGLEAGAGAIQLLAEIVSDAGS
jgi:hypothetical protein